jgi:hypothetical protein
LELDRAGVGRFYCGRGAATDAPVDQFFAKLDFRRFQIELTESIPMDEASGIPKLAEYGKKLGQKTLNNEWEKIEPLDTA